MAAHSYIIKGGTIIDGSGFPMTKGDVALSGETIKLVGHITGSATRIIDAEGKYIIPGIIDVANHSDTHWTLFNNPSQESLLRQGITTILGGLCGSSLAPLADMQAIRSIQKWTDLSKVNINWKTQNEFFDELERHTFGVNFGTLVGHGTLRRGIAGDSMRALEKNELESMKLLLRRSLDEGAMGLSIGLGTSHGAVVPQDELIELAKVTAETGKIVSIHLRNEGRYLLQSVSEVINIARSSGASIQITHFKAIGRKAWHDMRNALVMIKKAREKENLSLWADFFPYLRTGSLLYALLPEWMREGGKDTILEILNDMNRRADILEAIRSLTLHYDNLTVAEALKDKHAIGKTIAQLAQELETSPEEIIVRLLIINGLGVTIFGKTLRSKNLVMIAKTPYSMFGSDGVGESEASGKKRGDLTHPRSYGAAPRFLDRLVKKSGVLTWEEAIKKMTSIPALRMGISQSHGLIKKGYFANIVIIDPDILIDKATYSNPYQYPQGITHVFVNGRIAIENGVFTQALAGKILRTA